MVWFVIGGGMGKGRGFCYEFVWCVNGYVGCGCVLFLGVCLRLVIVCYRVFVRGGVWLKCCWVVVFSIFMYWGMRNMYMGVLWGISFGLMGVWDRIEGIIK